METNQLKSVRLADEHLNATNKELASIEVSALTFKDAIELLTIRKELLELQVRLHGLIAYMKAYIREHYE